MREAAEQDLTKVRAAYAEQRKESKEQNAKQVKYQAELDQLSVTIRQVEVYNEHMKSEIAVTRRATYKAEESVGKLESGKKQQDLIIDNLNEKLRRAQEELALGEVQLVAQRNESSAAAQTLKDASEEMEAIQFEKKQLLQQWKSALIGMQRRDEALQATEETLRKQLEQEMAIESEMAGLRKAIKGEADKSEVLTATQTKLETESRTMDTAIEAGREKESKQQANFVMLSKLLEQSDAELAKLSTTQASLQSEGQMLEARVQKVAMATKSMQNEVLSTLGEQMAMEKGTQNTANATNKVHQQVEEKEVVDAQLKNELARIKVDTLNVISQNTHLQSQLAVVNDELKEKDALMAKYEQESRRRNVEIEKKQHELDLLNRKFDGLMKQRAGAAELDEDAGPLEATIVNMKREIHAKSQECTELQRLWIKQQTDLVAVQNSNQAISEAQQDKRAKLAILQQRRLRTAAQFETHTKELRELERTESVQHTEMSKINRLVSEHQARQGQLADDNFLMETGFVERLRELESHAVGMEAQIVALKEEKERLLLDVREAEKQIMLIDKKIALERETQAALDPEVGAAEARAMQREIHRMRLRYSQLQRRQEMMISDMERAIYKRDNIEAKGKVQSQKKGAPPTQAALQKQVGGLSKKLKMTTHDANLTQMQVLRLQEAARDKGSQVELARADAREASDQVARVSKMLTTQQQQHAMVSHVTRRNHELTQKLLAANEGSYQPHRTEEQLQEHLADSEREAVRLYEVIDAISKEHVQYASQLHGMMQTVA